MGSRKEKGMTKRERRELEEQQTFDCLADDIKKTRNKKSGLEIAKKITVSFIESILGAVVFVYGILCVCGLPHMAFDALLRSSGSEWSDFMILYMKRISIFFLALATLKFPSVYRRVKNYLKKKSRTEIIKDILKSLDILQAFYLISIAFSLLLTLGIVCCLIYIENIEIIRKITVSSAGSDIIKFLFYLMIPVFVIEVVIRIIQFYARDAKLESRYLINMIKEWKYKDLSQADSVSPSDTERKL